LEAAQRHADLDLPLDVWYQLAKKAQWKNLMNVKRIFPSAEAVEVHGVQHQREHVSVDY
jgi:mRNA interferase HigB